MSEWIDYYEVLQVHSNAEPEVIKAAYRRLAQKYHPDTTKDPSATKKMASLNDAYEVLSNPQKRAAFHSEWRKRNVQNKNTTATPPPKPLVEPSYFRFDNADLGAANRGTFIIRNIGGPYNRIWVSNPDSWVKIVDYKKVGAPGDELPLAVEIEATGADWGRRYLESIVVKLDEEETQVRIELNTKKKPAEQEARDGPLVELGQLIGGGIFGILRIIGLGIIAVIGSGIYGILYALAFGLVGYIIGSIFGLEMSAHPRDTKLWEFAFLGGGFLIGFIRFCKESLKPTNKK